MTRIVLDHISGKRRRSSLDLVEILATAFDSPGRFHAKWGIVRAASAGPIADVDRGIPHPMKSAGWSVW